MLKKADKTWVVHQIHEFLDDDYQINKIWTDLCSHTVYEILEHFLNPGHGVQCESRSSLAESAILKYHWSRIGRDCRPWRLKFNMANVSKDCNIFPVYKLISHDIFILMFCNSLEQCKISLHSSCCTRVNRNHLFFQFFSQNFSKSINMTPSITKVGWCETNWHKKNQSWAYLLTHLVIPKGLTKRGKFWGGLAIMEFWGHGGRVTHFGIFEGKGG